ncbi:hypothetical protein [Nocardia aurea]|uniref:Uncharacterized protein n=1 Tax=Nocardia aurea TaxID=2144174 RepID=A0ABV3FKY2_9NOCA
MGSIGSPRGGRELAVVAVSALVVLASGATARAEGALGDLISGSAAPDSASGNAGGGVELALEPADPVSTGTTPTRDPVDVPVPANSADALGLDPGSVAVACSGSAAVGSSAIGSGLATGSGSGTPALIGTGSGGSGLGSAAVGSAAAGSAVLTCLLLLPAPASAIPAIPLRLEPPNPAVPVPNPVAPPTLVAPTAAVREIVSPVSAPVFRPRETVRSPPDPLAWNLLELVTVLVMTVVAGIRAGSPGSKVRVRGVEVD